MADTGPDFFSRFRLTQFLFHEAAYFVSALFADEPEQIGVADERDAGFRDEWIIIFRGLIRRGSRPFYFRVES